LRLVDIASGVLAENKITVH